MKKLLSLMLACSLSFGLAGCSSKDDKVIKVGASVTPHADIL